MSNKKLRPRTCKRRTQKKQSKQKNTRRKKNVTWGGNYDKDFTSTTLEGTPTKSPHRYTVAVPGQPIMSGRAYKNHMEYIDTHGSDI